MIGTKSRSICVKFREDDPNQMEAWHYLQDERGARTYAELIADMVKERNCEQSDGLLAEIRHARCRAIHYSNRRRKSYAGISCRTPLPKTIAQPIKPTTSR